ncbi:hypothetical protein T08_13543 [Trichinella sp. T8]|nr:hypothetical protein T08_13543 [Trichinella sp. T8]
MRVHTVIVPLFILNRDGEHLLLNVIYHSPIFLPYQIYIVIKIVLLCFKLKDEEFCSVEG